MYAWQVDSGDRSSDGWTVYSVSYELDGAPLGTRAQDTIITSIWTHEKRERPRSTLSRHRQWRPLDEFS